MPLRKALPGPSGPGEGVRRSLPSALCIPIIEALKTCAVQVISRPNFRGRTFASLTWAAMTQGAAKRYCQTFRIIHTYPIGLATGHLKFNGRET